MKRNLLLIVLAIFITELSTAQTTDVFVVADKPQSMESCIDSLITLAQIIEYTGIRDLNDPNDNPSKYKMFRLDGVMIKDEITTPIKYSDYEAVFIQKKDFISIGHSGLSVQLKVTTIPTSLFSVDTLTYTVEKGAKVNYHNDFFDNATFFVSDKDVERLDERIFFTDLTNETPEASWASINSSIFTVGKGEYKLRVKASVCTATDYFYDSLYVIVKETPCLQVQIKDLPSVCNDEIIDIKPYVYLDDHLATSEELANMKFSSWFQSELNPGAIDISAMNIDPYYKLQIIYQPNVDLGVGVCKPYSSYLIPTKVPRKTPESTLVTTSGNDGRVAYYSIEDTDYYSFNNVFNKDIFKKLYIDNYAVHNGTTFDFFSDESPETSVTGNNLTPGIYYIRATNPDCADDVTTFKTTIKERDFSIVWQPAESLGNGYYTFTAPTYPGASYSWQAWSGSIVSGHGTNQVTVYYSENALSTPYVTCMIILNNVRVTGVNLLYSAVYLTTAEDGSKEEIKAEDDDVTTGTSALFSRNTNNIVYPNPAAETFAVSGTDVYEVTIYNAIGKLVYTDKAYMANTPITINSKGMYVIHLNQKGITQTLKVALE